MIVETGHLLNAACCVVLPCLVVLQSGCGQQEASKIAGSEENTAASPAVIQGLTPEAKAVAKRFDSAIKSNADDFAPEVIQGQVTYCTLDEQSCSLLVRARGYGRLGEAAKQQLADLAWSTAQETVADTLKPGDKLMVDLREDTYVGRIMSGKVGEAEPEESSERAELAKIGENLSPSSP